MKYAIHDVLDHCIAHIESMNGKVKCIKVGMRVFHELKQCAWLDLSVEPVITDFVFHGIPIDLDVDAGTWSLNFELKD